MDTTKAATRQSWLQTLSIIASILVALGFFWVNVASKDDIGQLREDMNRRFEDVQRELTEIRTDIKTLEQDYKAHICQA